MGKFCPITSLVRSFATFSLRTGHFLHISLVLSSQILVSLGRLGNCTREKFLGCLGVTFALH